MKDTYGIEIGDTVRFVCEKTDDDGFNTGKIMRITGKCFLIELDNNINSSHFPTFHVRRNGKDYWYFGDNIQIIKKGKSNANT